MILVAILQAHLHFNTDRTILDATGLCSEKFKDTPQEPFDTLQVRFAVNVTAHKCSLHLKM